MNVVIIIVIAAVLAASFWALYLWDKKRNSIHISPIPFGTVEDCIANGKKYMDGNYDNYLWYETSISLKKYLDSEECSGEVKGITSVFQAIIPTSGSLDTVVVMYETSEAGTIISRKSSFWVGDITIKTEAMITFDEAFKCLMESNYPKPHSRQAVLREELGPVKCNPQYIFGNVQNHLYVDAVTGEVREKSPAFEGF